MRAKAGRRNGDLDRIARGSTRGGVSQGLDRGDDVGVATAAELQRMVEREPDRLDLRLWRAKHRVFEAMCQAEGAPESSVVESEDGIRYLRASLESALEDYDFCFRRGAGVRSAMRAATLLRTLGRYPESLRRYDLLLTELPTDSAFRPHVLERRREVCLLMPLSGSPSSSPSFSVQAGMRAQVAGSAGASNSECGQAPSAVQLITDDDQLVSDHDDTATAQDWACYFVGYAHEPAPELRYVSARSFPLYQRRFADTARRHLSEGSLRCLGDVEAQGLYPVVGQRVLLRIYIDAKSTTWVVTYAVLRPIRGALTWLTRMIKGEAGVVRMASCVSRYDDGTFLVTEFESPEPTLEEGPSIQTERMARTTSLVALLDRHQQRVVTYGSSPDRALVRVADLDDIEREWRGIQRARCQFRASVEYATEVELKAVLGRRYDAQASQVRASIALLVAQR